MFVGRSPPRDQYEFGRGHNFESLRGYGPRFPLRGARTPPMRCGMIPRGGHNLDRHGRMNFANPLLRKWLGTSLTLLVLSPVLSRLLARTLGFDFAGGRLGGHLVDRLQRMTTEDRRWSTSLTPLMSKDNIIFRDDGRERVIKVSRFYTLSCVASIKAFGLFCSLPYHMCLG
jgi:hypothetical protein